MVKKYYDIKQFNCMNATKLIKVVTAKKYLGLIAAILANDSTAKTAVKK